MNYAGFGNKSIYCHSHIFKSIAQGGSKIHSKFQSERKTCVFVAWHKKELPCEVCYWKIIFGIIFLITGLSLGILPLSVQSSAI